MYICSPSAPYNPSRSISAVFGLLLANGVFVIFTAGTVYLQGQERILQTKMHTPSVLIDSFIAVSASLDPHSSIAQSPQKHARVGQSMSCLGKANKLASHTSSFLALISSCKQRHGHTLAQSVRKKGKTLKKRRVHHGHVGAIPEHGAIGPAAGHALRVCFCQRGLRRCSQTQRRDELHASSTGLRESTPNARIVIGSHREGKGRTRRRTLVWPWISHEVDCGMCRLL